MARPPGRRRAPPTDTDSTTLAGPAFANLSINFDPNKIRYYSISKRDTKLKIKPLPMPPLPLRDGIGLLPLERFGFEWTRASEFQRELGSGRPWVMRDMMDMFEALSMNSDEKGLKFKTEQVDEKRAGYEVKKIESATREEGEMGTVKGEKEMEDIEMATEIGDASMARSRKRKYSGRGRYEEAEEIPSASERAFGTTEIVENVLAFLPPSDLLLCLSTCKTFKNCYDNSRELKLKTSQEVYKVVTGALIYRDLRNNGNGLNPGPVNTQPPAGAVGVPTNANNTVPNQGTSNTSTPNTTPASEAPVIFAVNKLLFEPVVRGRHNQAHETHQFKGAKGVQRARLICEPGKENVFEVIFSNPRFSNGWSVAHTGSWTKLHLYDIGMQVQLRVTYSDHRHYETPRGEVTVTKTATATLSCPSATAGQLFARARQVHAILMGYLFVLSTSTTDLMKSIDPEMKDSKPENLIACSVTTVKREKHLS
ncbi:hypothetical protein PRZ48_008987 [Zasmidium cellare]|uniref:F-box domain-containing protein n=1 Tax=Zasmidium cellare TaxID=395010 RepID=A0ABR0EH21_ZASCE|nr:hypothetical protein PRZ48_008987 [Zasmidium cellare]